MTHSIPAFPDMSFSSFKWGGASDTYAQSILCISLNATQVCLHAPSSLFAKHTHWFLPIQLDKAAYGMQFNDPRTYSSYMPPTLSSLFPFTTQLIAGQRRENSIVQYLTTVKGASFLQFAKTGKSDLELYSELVQPYLKVDM